MAPGSFRVPPLIVKVDEVVNADAIESVPPLIVNGPVDVRLLIVSVTLFEWTTSAHVLMVTSSPKPGRLLVFQFPGVSQLLSWAFPVQDTLDKRVRSSIHSSWGRYEVERSRPRSRLRARNRRDMTITSEVEISQVSAKNAGRGAIPGTRARTPDVPGPDKGPARACVRISAH